MGPQPARVAVEPTHVALVDRLHVVAHRPVVPVGVPGPLQRGRHLEHLGDFDAGVALVEQAQRLVVQVGVQIPLQRKEFDDALPPPRRPVVGSEHHIGAIGKGVDGLGEVAGPGVRVTHQRAAQGQQVVQIVGGVLGHAQRAEAREIEVHFGGRLGAGRHLELDLHAVDGVLLTGLPDVDGRNDDADLAGGRGLTEPATHVALGSARQQRAVHVGRATRHRRAGVHVLLDGMLDEAVGRQHRHRAAVHVGLRGDAQDAAEMIDVAVGVDHSDDGTVTAAVGAVQGQRRGRHLGGDQRIDDDDPGVALDKGDVREVEAADLIDARHHFVEALFGGEGRLPPQAGMDRRRRGTPEERVGVVVPHHAAVGRLDDARGQRRDESAIGVVEVRRVMERQRVFTMGRLDDRGRGFVFHRQYIAINAPSPDRTGRIHPTRRRGKNRRRLCALEKNFHRTSFARHGKTAYCLDGSQC